MATAVLAVVGPTRCVFVGGGLAPELELEDGGWLSGSFRFCGRCWGWDSAVAGCGTEYDTAYVGAVTAASCEYRQFTRSHSPRRGQGSFLNNPRGVNMASVFKFKLGSGWQISNSSCCGA